MVALASAGREAGPGAVGLWTGMGLIPRRTINSVTALLVVSGAILLLLGAVVVVVTVMSMAVGATLTISLLLGGLPFLTGLSLIGVVVTRTIERRSYSGPTY